MMKQKIIRSAGRLSIAVVRKTLNENGKPREALTRLNQVQTRARNTPIFNTQHISTFTDEHTGLS